MTEYIRLFISLPWLHLSYILLGFNILIFLPLNLLAGNHYVFPGDINVAEEGKLSNKISEYEFYNNTVEPNFFQNSLINSRNKIRHYRFPDGSRYTIRYVPELSKEFGWQEKDKSSPSNHFIDHSSKIQNTQKRNQFPGQEYDYPTRSNSVALYTWPEDQIMKTRTNSFPLKEERYFQQKYANTVDTLTPSYTKQNFVGYRNLPYLPSTQFFPNEHIPYDKVLRGLSGTVPYYSTSHYFFPNQSRFHDQYKHGFFNDSSMPQARILMESYGYPRR